MKSEKRDLDGMGFVVGGLALAGGASLIGKEPFIAAYNLAYDTCMSLIFSPIVEIPTEIYNYLGR